MYDRDQADILTINGGSSSIKFAIYRGGDALVRRAQGVIDRVGRGQSELTVADDAGRRDRCPIDAPNHRIGARALFQWLADHADQFAIGAVGHRIVHGGARHSAPHLVTPALLDELRAISPFAPEHVPHQIELIETIAERYPGMMQVACFDTAFHHDLPRVAQLLPIPRRFDAAGVRRYGFHGLSYTYLMGEIARVAGEAAARGRIILAHLGNGASMAAVRDGRCLDTTMSFTPAAGLVMATRSGDLDPGIVWYLSRAENITPEQFHDLVNRKSGLLGVSETTSDMRDLLAREATDVRAAEAVALFCYQARKWVGALAAVLGGLDLLVFTGGIGENAAPVRARICEELEYLGIRLDAERNAASAAVISLDASPATVRVMRTDEEIVIAEAVARVRAGADGATA